MILLAAGLVVATWLLIAAVIRRILGSRVGLLRTLAATAVVLVTAAPVGTWAGRQFGIYGSDHTLLVDEPVALLVGLLVFLWTLVVTIALLIVLEVIAPTGSVPTPWDAVASLRGLTRRSRRYLTLAWNLVTSGLWSALRHGPEDRRFAESLVRFLNRSGVTFVKLGQLLSTRTDLVPAVTTAALASLHADATPVPLHSVRRVLQEEWGQSPDGLVRELEEQPLAAASVAQVHRAVGPDGRPVVVKVQRPGARAQVAIDCDILLRFSRTTERRFAWGRALGLDELAHGLADNLAEEVDYRIEAANTVAAAAALADHPAITVPRMYPELCTQRVLVMSALSGVTATTAADRLTPTRRQELARELLHAVMDSIFVHGVFHTDLHPGNIMLLDDDSLALLDFGSIGVLDAETRELLAALLLAIVEDGNVAAALALTMCFQVPDDVDQHQLRRDLGRVITYLTHQEDVAGSFGDMFAVMRRHQIRVPADVAGVFRTLTSLDATLRALDPELGLLTGARELMPSLMGRLSAPERLSALATTQAVTSAAVLRRLPSRVETTSDALARGTFSIAARPFAHAADRRWIQDLTDDVVSAIFAVVGIVLGVTLLLADGGPQVTGELSLYDVLGAAIGFLGAILTLRLVVRVFTREPRDGR